MHEELPLSGSLNSASATGPVFILAGEPSGDQLAAKIMGAIDGAYGRQDWFGIGGAQMQAAGLRPEGDMEQLSVIGFGAALTAYPRLSRLADQLVARVTEAKPRAILTVDAKGFSLRFALRLKRRMAEAGWWAPIIHTVAPTVWAWGEWRAASAARAIDGLLCLFPFEPAYFTAHGVRAHFIGHPEAFNPALEVKDAARNVSAVDKRGEGKRLLLLPGSRRSEIKRILPIIRDAALQVTKTGAKTGAKTGKIEISLATMPHLVEQVTAVLGSPTPISVVSGREAFYTHLHAADAVMAASGTVTLQTALAGVAGVTCYRTSALSALIGRRLVKMDRVILPNALLDRDVYPFLFQQAATPHALAKMTVLALNQERTKMHQTAAELRGLLRGGAADFETLVANSVAEWFIRKT